MTLFLQVLAFIVWLLAALAFATWPLAPLLGEWFEGVVAWLLVAVGYAVLLALFIVFSIKVFPGPMVSGSEKNSDHCGHGTRYVEETHGSGKGSYTIWWCEGDPQ